MIANFDSFLPVVNERNQMAAFAFVEHSFGKNSIFLCSNAGTSNNSLRAAVYTLRLWITAHSIDPERVSHQTNGQSINVHPILAQLPNGCTRR